MGEVSKYDPALRLFGNTNISTGRRMKVDVEAIKNLKVGEYWHEKHNCPSPDCKKIGRVRAAAVTYLGKGNYATTHSNGLIAVLRKA